MVKRATGSTNCRSLAAARWAKVGLALCVALTGVPVAPAYGDELATTFEEGVRDVSAPQEGEAAAEDDAPSGESFVEAVDQNTDIAEGDEEPAQQAAPQEAPAEEAAAIEPIEALSDAVVMAEDAGELAEQPLEGPENSWRYDNGVRIISGLSSEIATFGAEPGYDTYVTWTKANGSKSYTYRANPTDKSEIVTVPNTTGVGIDVSVHQGKIDWAKVKADGINFAIIRLGYGSDYTSQDDTYFLDNVKGAKANGIPFGVYLYSYATKATGAAPSAASEADHALRQLKAAGLGPNDLAMPVFYDLEDKTQASLSTSELASLAKAFCDKITAAGYKAGIYANQNWWTTKLTDPTFARSGWSKWVAQYFQSKQTAPKNISDQQYWQFTDCGKVNGINGYVDVNFSYAPPVASLTGPANTWTWVDGKAYYYGKDGNAVVYEQTIDGKYYYFNSKHQMHTGWLTWIASGLKSYFKLGADGKAPALTGWQGIDGKWYYFDPATGKSLRYEHWINGNFFYFNSKSEMHEGWLTWIA
ncbi:glycoside hydrolase family 25 protein, partial [uncultured Adlercreutzia sp.]|uniref:glycoside hydrolase family 25 protein n=1 Tax=uncultured Adlercreutzia sp. TaxID=875803 RepID=UPI0026F3AD77